MCLHKEIKIKDVQLEKVTGMITEQDLHMLSPRILAGDSNQIHVNLSKAVPLSQAISTMDNQELTREVTRRRFLKQSNKSTINLLKATEQMVCKHIVPSKEGLLLVNHY